MLENHEAGKMEGENPTLPRATNAKTAECTRNPTDPVRT